MQLLHISQALLNTSLIGRFYFNGQILLWFVFLTSENKSFTHDEQKQLPWLKIDERKKTACKVIMRICILNSENYENRKTFAYLAAIRSLIFLQRFFRAFWRSLSRAILGSILSAGASTMCRMLYDARSSLEGSTPSCWCCTASWCFRPRKWLNRYTSEPIWKQIHPCFAHSVSHINPTLISVYNEQVCFS